VRIKALVLILFAVATIFFVFGLARGWWITPQELPAYFIHISDETQIGLRMHRDDIERVLGIPLEDMDIEELSEIIYEVNEETLNLLLSNVEMNRFTYHGNYGVTVVDYNDKDLVIVIFTLSPEWIIADWGAVGIDIQSVLDKRRTFNIAHHDWSREVFVNVPMYGLMFSYDRDRNIEFIQLSMSMASGYFEE